VKVTGKYSYSTLQENAGCNNTVLFLCGIVQIRALAQAVVIVVRLLF